LKPERPVWRLNWALRPTPRLDLTSRHQAWLESTKHGARLDDCWLRVERQTLSKLPVSGYTLFTIHTYQEQVTALTVAQRHLLEGVLRSTPPDTLAYKGLGFLAPYLSSGKTL
jgi:dimethylamine monooxygenase subunit A